MSIEGSHNPHLPWTEAEVGTIWKEVASETDRGCVILCAAHLDRGLEKLLRLKLRALSDGTEKEIDKLLIDFPTAALHSFAARARAAHLLGALNRETSEALRKFAKLRNDFAHKDIPPPLSESVLLPIIESLPEWWQDAVKVIVISLRAHPVPPIVDNTPLPRLRLICTTSMLYAIISVAIHYAATTKHPSPPTLEIPPAPLEVQRSTP